MERTDSGDAEFGERIGRDRTMVSKLRRGLLRPTLDLAAVIERETAGEVPIRAWLPTPTEAQEAA